MINSIFFYLHRFSDVLNRIKTKVFCPIKHERLKAKKLPFTSIFLTAEFDSISRLSFKTKGKLAYQRLCEACMILSTLTAMFTEIAQRTKNKERYFFS